MRTVAGGWKWRLCGLEGKDDFCEAEMEILFNEC